MAKMGTQDKVRAKNKKRQLLSLAKHFEMADLGDRADRIGPDMVDIIKEIAAIEGWDD